MRVACARLSTSVGDREVRQHAAVVFEMRGVEHLPRHCAGASDVASGHGSGHPQPVDHLQGDGFPERLPRALFDDGRELGEPLGVVLEDSLRRVAEHLPNGRVALGKVDALGAHGRRSDSRRRCSAHCSISTDVKASVRSPIA